MSLAITLVEYELERFPSLIQAGWTVKTSKARRRLGLCDYVKKSVILSEPMIILNEPPKVREVGLHEIAHALTPGHGHDAVWEAQARALGISANRCDTNAVLPPGRYLAVCPTCNATFHRYRQPAAGRSYHCRRCGKVMGRLSFVRVW